MNPSSSWVTMVKKAPVIDLVSSDSSLDRSSDNSSDSSSDVIRVICIHGSKRLEVRGPDVMGFETFDPYCVFGNHVALDHAHLLYLRTHCVKHQPTMPMYVCTMQKSHVIERKDKMYFRKSYTRTYRKQYLTLATKVMVYCNKKPIVEVKINVEKAKSKRALMTSLWMFLVKNKGFTEGDVVSFWFCRISPNRLKLIVNKIKPCRK